MRVSGRLFKVVCYLVFLLEFVSNSEILLVNCVLTFVITFVGVIVSNALTFVNTFFSNFSMLNSLPVRNTLSHLDL